ncbi:glycosyltransferase family protein [Epibacterium ulvae]|uniref:glycosyltransferase family protein n=1 Tax=Epibacterium ulvae TaxID=1156985 RepID=UPI0024903151|nr:glycosyltransferase [Epibacterium ulvae]
MRVQILVTHLLGTGHLSRALTLARAFQDAGHKIELISGGGPAPQLNTSSLSFVQLPALRSDGVNFTRLLTPEGRDADTAYLQQRTDQLIKTIRAFQPEILITELYPFGRRSLRSEFITALEVAKSLDHPATILASIRDILAPPSKPQKAVDADAIIAQYYDGVLVHSDPNTTQLNLSWPVSTMLASKLHYTGFVAPPAPTEHPHQLGTGEILVSAGGGNVGDALYRTALEAAKATPDLTWRLLVGGSDAAARIVTYQSLNTPALIEPARPDFRQMLCHAKASVSMCGYNTALDLLQTGCPALIAPFDAGNEVEQSLRANALSQLPGIATISSADLTATTLLSAVKKVCADPPRAIDLSQFDGATQTVTLACKIAKHTQSGKGFR